MVTNGLMDAGTGADAGAGAEGTIFNIQRYSLHDGPGIRTTVFMKGCPLRCLWCSNPESQRLRPQRMGDAMDSRAYTVDEALAVCLKDLPFYEESGGGVTISGGEPLVQWPYVAALTRALKRHGVHCALETTGYAPWALFARATADVDLILFDVKHHDAERHRSGTGVEPGQIVENLGRAIAAGKAVLPRIPVIPGYNDTPADAQALGALLRSVNAARVQLLPFHQLGDQKYTTLGLPYAMRGEKPLYPEALEDYRSVFLQQGVDAFF